MISRRDVHKGLFAFALLGASRGFAATSHDNIALNRLTFGATMLQRDAFAQMGLRGWLDRELAKPADDPALVQILRDARLPISYEAGETGDGATWGAVDEMRPFGLLNSDPAEMLHLLDFEKPMGYPERVRAADEVVATSLIRAVHADAQLREVMTAFWHEHFSVNAYKQEATAVYFPSYDKMLRANAFGNFRDMLGQVARAPAMLTYLNNEASRASPANENFARELLELHTLGAMHYHNDLYDNWRDVPGAMNGMAQGYIDQDVYEVARAFTGWSVGDGRYVNDGVDAPKTGAFHYVEEWHDPYQKRILGIEFAPNRGPMDDGDRVLDLLAVHPGTARFVTRKLLIRLGIEDPSEAYQKAVMDAFLRHSKAPDQIAQVLRTLVLHDEFTATPARKMRRPFEFMAAIYRASGARVTSPTLGFNWHLERAGWTQHAVRPPTGHSDATVDWANTRTLNGLVNIALYAHEDWMDTQEKTDDVQSVTTLIAQTEAQFAVPAGTVRDACQAMGVSDDADPAWAVSVMHAAAALHPQFMLR